MMFHRHLGPCFHHHRGNQVVGLLFLLLSWTTVATTDVRLRHLGEGCLGCAGTGRRVRRRRRLGLPVPALLLLLSTQSLCCISRVISWCRGVAVYHPEVKEGRKMESSHQESGGRGYSGTNKAIMEWEMQFEEAGTWDVCSYGLKISSKPWVFKARV